MDTSMGQQVAVFADDDVDMMVDSQRRDVKLGYLQQVDIQGKCRPGEAGDMDTDTTLATSFLHIVE